MKIQNIAKLAAATILAPMTLAVANAQDQAFKIPASLSYARSSPRDTWNTVLVVSAGVLIIGLIQDDSTLTILGGAGTLVSLVQLNQTHFRPQYSPRGISLLSSGPVSFGVTPFGSMNAQQGFRDFRPGAYIAANFKF